MSVMVAKYQLSRRSLQEFLQDYFNFHLSLGTVFNKQKLVNRVLSEPLMLCYRILNKVLLQTLMKPAIGNRGNRIGYGQWHPKRPPISK